MRSNSGPFYFFSERYFFFFLSFAALVRCDQNRSLSDLPPKKGLPPQQKSLEIEITTFSSLGTSGQKPSHLLARHVCCWECLPGQGPKRKNFSDLEKAAVIRYLLTGIYRLHCAVRYDLQLPAPLILRCAHDNLNPPPRIDVRASPFNIGGVAVSNTQGKAVIGYCHIKLNSP